jgi:cytoskeletal protein CcmA (bactofilin family)
MAININHPTNTIEGLDILNLNSGNSSNIELTPDSGLVNVNGSINVIGNFTVQGTTTTINSTTSSLVDPILLLGTDVDGNPINVNDGKDRGVAFYYNDGYGNKTGFFGYDRSLGKFRLIPDATISSEVVSGDDGTLALKQIDVGDLSISADAITSTTGNIDVSGNTISNLGTPNAATDAATKDYVDNAASAISVLNVSGDSASGSVDLATGTLTVNGTTYQIQTAVVGDVLTISLPLNLIAPGSLEVTTDLTVNGTTTLIGSSTATSLTSDSLTVNNNATISGNLDVNNNLEVTGTTNLIGTTTASNLTATNLTATNHIDTTTLTSTGNVDVGGILSVAGNTDISGNLNVDGNVVIGGNITIGDQSIDTVNITADITSNLIPKTTLTYDLGSISKQWNNIYVGSVTTSGITSGNVNISGNTISAADTNGDLNLASNGTGSVNINGKKVGTDTDALMYAIVFGG